MTRDEAEDMLDCAQTLLSYAACALPAWLFPAYWRLYYWRGQTVLPTVRAESWKGFWFPAGVAVLSCLIVLAGLLLVRAAAYGTLDASVCVTTGLGCLGIWVMLWEMHAPARRPEQITERQLAAIMRRGWEPVLDERLCYSAFRRVAPRHLGCRTELVRYYGHGYWCGVPGTFHDWINVNRVCPGWLPMFTPRTPEEMMRRMEIKDRLPEDMRKEDGEA